MRVTSCIRVDLVERLSPDSYVYLDCFLRTDNDTDDDRLFARLRVVATCLLHSPILVPVHQDAWVSTQRWKCLSRAFMQAYTKITLCPCMYLHRWTREVKSLQSHLGKEKKKNGGGCVFSFREMGYIARVTLPTTLRRLDILFIRQCHLLLTLLIIPACFCSAVL